ncbi:hypothetical protein N665_1225s0001 [Sinapis alba]|nr:hypothetical protein N665_1225s0001 [Sinapis alba]
MQEDQVIAYGLHQLRLSRPLPYSWFGVTVVDLEIVTVREESSDSQGSAESKIYLHLLKLVLGQCIWIELVVDYSLDITYHLEESAGPEAVEQTYYFGEYAKLMMLMRLFFNWEIIKIDQLRFHGFLVNFVSDRDVKFTSSFWRAFQKALGTMSI